MSDTDCHKEYCICFAPTQIYICILIPCSPKSSHSERAHSWSAQKRFNQTSTSTLFIGPRHIVDCLSFLTFARTSESVRDAFEESTQETREGCEGACSCGTACSRAGWRHCVRQERARRPSLSHRTRQVCERAVWLVRCRADPAAVTGRYARVGAHAVCEHAE